MERMLRLRMISLVSILMVVSMFCSMVTDVQFYIDKLRDKHSTFKGSWNEDGNLFDPVETNDFGKNIGLRLDPLRQKNSTDSEIKYILFWNEAYGSKEYDLGFGRQPFYDNKCPETRCLATDNRSMFPVEKFDAIFFHQRSLDFNDIPEKRLPSQRYVHYIMESAQYLYLDIGTMNNFFNWTMTYRRDSDFYRPYARIVKIKSHPEGKDLEEFIKKFGRENKHLARGNKENKAAWFVSHCATQARREKYVKMLKKKMDVDVYGKCGKLKCDRANETDCYVMMEQNYKFYLSFENSICEDYVTEKFFNILKYNVIPVTYNGANISAIAPPHSYINTLDFSSVSQLAKYLQKVASDDELYASYFWWKEFYEVRDRREDMSQSFCEMCDALHNDKNNKVYNDLVKWWVTQSRCKKLHLS